MNDFKFPQEMREQLCRKHLTQLARDCQIMGMDASNFLRLVKKDQSYIYLYEGAGGDKMFEHLKAIIWGDK